MTNAPQPASNGVARALLGTDRAARTLLGLILLAMVALNVVNALGRYVFSHVFIGSDELLVFAMIWMIMVGMLLVTAERSHIALEIVTVRVGPRGKAALAFMHHAIIAVAGGYAAWQSALFVSKVTQQTSMAMGIPMVIPHIALTVGIGGTAIIAAVLAANDCFAWAAGHRRGRAS